MATIIKRGESYRAVIRRLGHKTITKTFRTKTAAAAWARKIEADIDDGKKPQVKGKTVSEVIQKYRELRDASRPIGETSNEHYMLNHLEEGLGTIYVSKLSTQDLIAWCLSRSEEGAGPYTLDMEVSKLGTAMKYASSALGLPYSLVIEEARPTLKHYGLIGPGNQRDRRPSDDELTRILCQLASPYADIVRFAVELAMRRGEIGRITWADLNEQDKMILIRDRKHPTKKNGNHKWVPLLGESFDIIQRQPKTEDRIFPVKLEDVSDLFLEACRAEGIVNLHFHDMRHEAISRLFEKGYQIQQVALVSGHIDWRHLRRYANLKPKDLHDIKLPSGALR